MLSRRNVRNKAKRGRDAFHDKDTHLGPFSLVLSNGLEVGIHRDNYLEQLSYIHNLDLPQHVAHEAPELLRARWEQTYGELPK